MGSSNITRLKPRSGLYVTTLLFNFRTDINCFETNSFYVPNRTESHLLSLFSWNAVETAVTAFCHYSCASCCNNQSFYLGDGIEYLDGEIGRASALSALNPSLVDICNTGILLTNQDLFYLTNCVDPHPKASEESIWSGCAQFVIQSVEFLQNLHQIIWFTDTSCCLKLIYSAGQSLKNEPTVA